MNKIFMKTFIVFSISLINLVNLPVTASTIDTNLINDTKIEEPTETNVIEKQIDPTKNEINQENETTLNKEVENSTIVETQAVPSVLYVTHVQTVGWMNYVNDGQLSGSTGKSYRLEGIKIKLETSEDLSIKYSTHIQNIGWQTWKTNDELSGTTGLSLRLEGIKIVLEGTDALKYDIYYHVHIQDYGWLDWAKNGEAAGSEGLSKRLEAIEIKILPKGADLNQVGITIGNRFITNTTLGNVVYTSHVESIGWQAWVNDGLTIGTEGKSLRLEAFYLKLGADLVGPIEDGTVLFRSHVQDIGWMDWVSSGSMSGTTGQSKRLEAISIKLDGKVAELYDIYYRVHVQNFGWLDWAKNGQDAGSAGYAYRAEAIEVVLVPKNGPAPGSTDIPFKEKIPQGKYDILGDAIYTKEDMKNYFSQNNPSYNSNAIVQATNKFGVTTSPIKPNGTLYTYNEYYNAVIDAYYSIAPIYGIRADVAVAQMIKETGFLTFSGIVQIDMFNFAGIYAPGQPLTDDDKNAVENNGTDLSKAYIVVGEYGARFSSIANGVEGHIQHLLAYAKGITPTSDNRIYGNTIADPKYKVVKNLYGGQATTVQALGGKWAPSLTYGNEIAKILDSITPVIAGKLIVIDPGHGTIEANGYYDPGASGNGLIEAMTNTLFAFELGAKLQAAGANVIYTHTNIGNNNPPALALRERAYLANNINATIFISIHSNANTSSSANGTETYYYLPSFEDNPNYSVGDPRIIDSVLLADSIQPKMSSGGGYFNRGVKGADFAVIRETKMPAILLEIGFLTNPNDAAKINDSGNRTSVVNGIYNGIEEYFKNYLNN